MADLTTHTIRARTNEVLFIIATVICVGIVVAQFAVGHYLTGIKAGAIVLLVIYLLWLLFWSPSVRLSPENLGVRNLLRHYDIRWNAISELPLGLTMRAVVGARKITLMAIPGRSNSGRSYGRGAAYARSGMGSLDAAFDVRSYWKSVRVEGPAAKILHDDAPIVVRWLVPEILILIVLVIVAVLVVALVK
jgi:hypothetical protein